MVTQELFNKLKPMLAVSSEPFDSSEFLYEVKWDGFRCLSYLDDNKTVLHSRNNLDFSLKFPELAGINKLARGLPLILDGEIIIMDQGVPSFYELQKRGWTREPQAIMRAARANPATYVVFDILYAGDEKLTELPLSRRKEILIQTMDVAECLFISESIPVSGRDFYAACIARGLEGVVAKKSDSRYLPGKRSDNWRKFKKAFEGDFVICGFKQTHPGSDRVDVLLLGGFDSGQLHFQGTVGVGLGGIAGQRMYQLLHPLKSDTSLFPVPKEVLHRLSWVRPQLCCSVEFLEPARDGGLRHPVFRGVREELGVTDCTGITGALGGR